ncbi:MAG TPA: hypothetical protein IAC22_07690 [Candidatus Caccocola faecipullorum]|nr:hypothetical protein [Candidatus Caccocola faecipullorum]
MERAFLDAMAEAGIPPADNDTLRLDGRKHRYRVRGDKGSERSGEYCVYMDESPAGYFKSYKASHGVPYTTWFFRNGAASGWTDEERRRYIEECAARKEESDKEKAIAREKAINIAQVKWETASEANPLHKYILKKGLSGAHGARQLGDLLVIPYYFPDGSIATVQTISGDGSKRFEKDAPKMGNFCFLSGKRELAEGGKKALSTNGCSESGGLPSVISARCWVCEGWATGRTIADALGDDVIVAADAGNLRPVIDNVREKWGQTEFVVAADNDRYKRMGNTGGAAAFKIFEETGIPFVFPDFDEGEKLSDWNDYAAKFGLKKTRAAMLAKLEQFKARAEFKTRHAYPQFVHVSESTGRPKGTIANLEALLAYAGISVKYDEIKKEGIIGVPGREYCGDDVKNATLGHILSLCAQWGFPSSNVDPFLSEVAARNVINPVREWILSEPWDGIHRIGNVYDSVVEEKGFPRAFKELLMRKWLVSAAAAAFHPRGFHYRGVLVLIGGQGIGKTTWFRNLAGRDEFFNEGIGLDPNDKDSLKRAISFWITELGELEGTFKRSDMSALKNFLTRSTDVLRMPWGRRMSEFQRRTVFGATVNQREILIDDTGNSRWWCIPVERMDMIDRRDMQQIWAEVYEDYYMRGTEDPLGQWWLTKDEEAELARQNWQFEAPNPVEELLTQGLDWEIAREFWQEMTATEALIEAGFVGVPRPGDAMKAARVLRKLTGTTSKKTGHANARLWRVPPKKLKQTASVSYLYR